MFLGARAKINSDTVQLKCFYSFSPAFTIADGTRDGNLAPLASGNGAAGTNRGGKSAHMG